jgi:predicted MFS family arabinose efflux permease
MQMCDVQICISYYSKQRVVNNVRVNVQICKCAYVRITCLVVFICIFAHFLIYTFNRPTLNKWSPR